LGGEEVEEEEEVGRMQAVVEGEEGLDECDETGAREQESVEDGLEVRGAAADGDEGLAEVVPEGGVEGEGGHAAG
jgi:hypothetical protein